MRTAAFPLRLGLSLPSKAGTNAGENPASRGMYGRSGLGRKSAPFVGVMMLAIAVLPLPPAGDGLPEIALASALTALILGTVWLAPWHRLPAFAEVVRSVIEEIVNNGVPVLTIRDIENSLQVSSEAAARIVERLVSAGLLVEAREGTWIKVSP